MGEIITEQPVMYTTDDGAQVWYLNGERHRVDGPAYIDGICQEWYLNGELHRTDGPAVIDGGHQAWYLNGELHNTDGPAIISGDYQAWYLNGVKCQFNDWIKKVNATPEEKTMLRLKWVS